MPRRRILVVFNRYIHYGGEELVAGQINEYLRQDHEVELCYFASSDWAGSGAPGMIEQIRQVFYNPESAQIFRDMVDAFKPDVAIFHNIFPVGSPSLYQAAMQCGVPVLQYNHAFRPFSVGGSLYVKGQFTEESLRGNYWREVWHGAWRGSVIRSAVMALVLRRLHRSGWLDQVKGWLCISDFIRQKFSQTTIQSERLFTLRHPWVPGPEPETRDQGYYLFLGRLVSAKGVTTLLEAWRQLEKQLGEQTPELWIAGQGDLEGQVQKAASTQKKIRWKGLLLGEPKHEALRGCRALIAPSIWWEPLGLVTYEAYDYGKPVLAAASGGLTETIQDGVTGLLHEPGNVEALVASVLQMEGFSDAQREQMGAAGRSWLLAEAGVDDWRARFNEILETVLAREAR